MEKDQIKSNVALIEFYYKWAAITATKTSFNNKKLGKTIFIF